jgi:prolipoprotein diacylglyceryltransferase
VWRNAQYSSAAPTDLRGTEQIYLPLFFIECLTNLFGYFFIAHVFGKALGKYHEPGDLCFGYVIW